MGRAACLKPSGTCILPVASDLTMESTFAFRQLLCPPGPDTSHQSFRNVPALLKLRAVQIAQVSRTATWVTVSAPSDEYGCSPVSVGFFPLCSIRNRAKWPGEGQAVYWETLPAHSWWGFSVLKGIGVLSGEPKCLSQAPGIRAFGTEATTETEPHKSVQFGRTGNCVIATTIVRGLDHGLPLFCFSVRQKAHSS